MGQLDCDKEELFDVHCSRRDGCLEVRRAVGRTMSRGKRAGNDGSKAIVPVANKSGARGRGNHLEPV